MSSDDNQSKLVLPAEIPFATLKDKDLEECVYWLLDSLGARDLEWRVGGKGGGAADGGRDLEAWFYVPSPDGDMEGQRWWVECKGRTGTLEKDAVVSACINTLAQSDLSHLVIVTNTTFSNPTRDWVRQWQASHSRPKVKLWDQSSLERMLSKHPNAVFRLFSQALSTAGLLEVAREGFWNRFDYATPKMLARFWEEREQLSIGALERIALVASEFAQGSIEQHPWAVACDDGDTLHALATAIANLPFLLHRAVRGGIKQEPLIRGVAYLILAALLRYTAKAVADLVLDHCRTPKQPFPKKVRNFFLGPVLNTLSGELQDVCSSDCERFGFSDRRSLEIGPDPISIYWWRFRSEGVVSGEDDRLRLRFEKHDAPCKVGFSVNKERTCPLFDDDDDVDTDNLEPFLYTIQCVSLFRIRQAVEGDREV